MFLRWIFVCGFILLGYWSEGQSLMADAGSDTVYCGLQGSIQPRLGGLQVATGGSPPYTYEWRMVSNPGAAFYFLDSVNGSNPQIVSSPLSNSEVFRVKVTDDLGDTAADDVTVYFSHWKCVAAECFKTKGQLDTVTISPICWSSLLPLSFRWTDGKYLSDSTANHPRCWVPVTTTLSVKIADAQGCFMTTTCSVYVSTAIVPDISPTETLFFLPNPFSENLTVRIAESLTGGILGIYSTDGRVAAEVKIIDKHTSLKNLDTLTPGVYFYRYQRRDDTPWNGRIVKY